MEISRAHYGAVVSLIFCAWAVTASGLHQGAESATDQVRPLPNYVETLPYILGDWEGRDVPIDDHAFTILNRDADAWIVREYTKGTARVILSLVTTVDQRKLFRVHIPDICLPAQGWEVKERVAQPLHLNQSQPIMATSLLAEKDRRTSQVVYWFTSNNRVIESKILHRLLMVWDGVVGQRTPGTLIELTSPLMGQNRKAVLQTQEEFAQLVLPFFPAVDA